MRKLRYNRATNRLEPVHSRLQPSSIIGHDWSLRFYATNPYLVYSKRNNQRCFDHTLEIQQNNPTGRGTRSGWLGIIADLAVQPAARNNPWGPTPNRN